MTDEQIYAALTSILRAVFGDDDLSIGPQSGEPDMPFADSVKMVELILEVESRFGVRVRARDLDALHSPADWVALIRREKS